ncbi:hypothetical protein [Pseudomonas cremoricolorata]|uniref:Uncharacterized protein n=1 Tax=Pseudomonas cremoricolorata TaxID=157783 RepID=A0A089WMS7_9PSED|nr:hypothetical protein [Pseudomonas cremoricolorata]AIR90595.1 hypothetical protein LK03_15495 [Pseudomonas cremoricolorata]
MGIKLIDQQNIAPWNRKVIAPITNGLEGYFTFDTDASRFAFNRVPGKPGASLVGNPQAFPTHGRFTSLANFIQTNIAETDSMTIICLGKAVDVPGSTIEASTCYVSNFNGPSITPGFTGTTTGTSLYHNGPTALNGTGCRSNGSGGAVTGGSTITNDTPTQWGIRAVRVDAAVGSKVLNLTTGLSSTLAYSNARLLNSRKMRIGGAYTQFAAQADISAVAIFSVALSDAQITAFADWMRIRANRLGIPA